MLKGGYAFDTVNREFITICFTVWGSVTDGLIGSRSAYLQPHSPSWLMAPQLAILVAIEGLESVVRCPNICYDNGILDYIYGYNSRFGCYQTSQKK